MILYDDAFEASETQASLINFISFNFIYFYSTNKQQELTTVLYRV